MRSPRPLCQNPAFSSSSKKSLTLPVSDLHNWARRYSLSHEENHRSPGQPSCQTSANKKKVKNLHREKWKCQKMTMISSAPSYARSSRYMHKSASAQCTKRANAKRDLRRHPGWSKNLLIKHGNTMFHIYESSSRTAHSVPHQTTDFALPQLESAGCGVWTC